ncbi:MAG: hypothetical protein HY646_14625 [Acidobacteria bacterium]|nr:hypothetical protein [Acidobacteriota bacterium]
MVLKHTLWAMLFCLAALPAAQAQDAKTLLSNALKAMGAENLKTLRFSGSGSVYVPVPDAKPNQPWTQIFLKSYTHELDLGSPASRVETVRAQGTPATEQKDTVVASASAPWETQTSIWLTPYGFLKGAMSNTVTLSTETIKDQKFNVLTFTLPGGRQVNGFIDDKNMVDRIRTRVNHPVLGDALVEMMFLQYRDIEGVKIPMAAVQRYNDNVSMVIVIEEAKPNGPVNISTSSPIGF